jgi:hypothetical protein
MLLFSVANAQDIKFISKTTNKPLANVLVFDKNGNVLTKNLIGKIASSLTQLVYSLRFLKMILRNKRMPENRF